MKRLWHLSTFHILGKINEANGTIDSDFYCSFQGLSPYKTIGTAPTTTQGEGQKSPSADNDKKTSASKGPIEIQELYKPQGKGIIPLFEATKHSIDEAYTSQEVRKIITEYIKESELANPRNQRYVHLLLLHGCCSRY